MNYKAHRIGGVCAGVIFSAITITPSNPSEKIVYSTALILGSIVGSLIPDLDHPRSVIGKKVKPVSKGISKAFGHRGLTHSPAALVLYSIFMLKFSSNPEGYYELLFQYAAIGSAVGYLSHLVLDMLTIGGIPLFYPISKKKFKLAKFKTDRHYHLVSFICIVVTVLSLVFIYNN